MSRFWKFAHLSDQYASLHPMDRVPHIPNLYIGGLGALDCLEEAGITHILSVLEFDYCEEYDRKYKRLLVQVDDEPHENLLRHFGTTSLYLDAALRQGGRVLVHCAMGLSRSAAVVAAFLMFSRGESWRGALEALRAARPLVGPNEGFVEQLRVYGGMLGARSDGEAEGIYGRWERNKYNSKM